MAVDNDPTLGILDTADRSDAAQQAPKNPLDSEANKAQFRKLLAWFYYERDKQAQNRLEMAMDADFYDGQQWTPEDAAAVSERGQMPLVYNEIAPMVDWIIGTERRSRVDWSVLPRTEDAVQIADAKTKVMKYVADVNNVAFERSRAFADAVKSGVGWLDDGARDDPTQDALYSKYEDWRCVLWDSASYQPDLSDCRYLFRWRWVDEDVALAAFPDRADQIRRAARNFAPGLEDDEFDTIEGTSTEFDPGSSPLYLGNEGILTDERRVRVRLIECQFRMPANVKIAQGGAFDRAILNPADAVGMQAAQASGSELIDRVMMRMHVAVMTENDLLSLSPSPYRHNGFSLTPVWCYRNGRTRLPYGVVRRVRDVQQDMNKRASKALFLLSTNQIFAEQGATDDWDALREQVDRPDGTIVMNGGKSIKVQRDTDAASGQINMMQLAATSIQKSAGVSDENLGRQTNAVSGEAIKARQIQGSVVTTEPFDNLRMAVQAQGQKQLSLVEQFYTEQKAIRLSGAKGTIEWLKINQPEPQPDGSVRYLNDITASLADFVVSQQDYSGTLRQVMFDSLNSIAQKLPPPMAMRLIAIAMEYSDLPNKDEVADQVRQAAGIQDPSKPMTPEEQQAAQQQAAIQQDAMQLQRQQAVGALQEQQAKIRELNARAAQLESQTGGATAATTDAVRAGGDAAVAKLAEQLRQLQADVNAKISAIKSGADVSIQIARINADAKIQVAEITAAAKTDVDALAAQVARATPPNVDPNPIGTPAPEPATPTPAPAPEPAPADSVQPSEAAT